VARATAASAICLSVLQLSRDGVTRVAGVHFLPLSVRTTIIAQPIPEVVGTPSLDKGSLRRAVHGAGGVGLDGVGA